MRLKQWTATSALALALATTGCVSISGDDPTLRTPGEMLDDRKIERLAKQNVAADERLATSHVNVVSYDGIVLLTGEVEDDALRARAERLVGNVPNVRRIHNEIQVGGATSFFARANDSWLTTKVFSKFAADSAVDASRIKVVSENGVVYLIGVVPRDHAAAAAEAARSVFGVRKVVKVFDYL